MPTPDTITIQVAQLLESAAVLCRAPVILHDYQAATRLATELRWHMSPPCLWAKSTDSNKRCAEFCGDSGTVDRLLVRYPEGYVHRCPFGQWKVAIPLLHGSALAGILFAGPFPDVSGQSGGTPEGSRQEWLERCCTVLHAVSCRLLQVLPSGERLADSSDRRRAVTDFLNARYNPPPRLEELAQRLNLSPSRTRHLVAELFGMSFSALSLETRLKRAGVLVAQTELPMSDIALRLGFCDASHFTNAFRNLFGMSPREYRRAGGPARAASRYIPADEGEHQP